MIIFIEGSDCDGKNSLYSKILESAGQMFKKSDVYLYDIMGEYDNERHALHDMHSKINMLMDLSDQYKNLRMVINNGPVSLVVKALDMGDARLASEMSSVFSRRQYHNIAIMSVFSADDDKNTQDAYRQVSSRHMSVISDPAKRNSYTLFLNRQNGDTQKLFNNDVVALINN